MKFRTDCPLELLYADDLVFIAESMGEVVKNEEKNLRENAAQSSLYL